MSSPSVDQLVADGKYGEAAQLARESGDFARAAALFERIWDFASAATAARAAGDLGRALRNAIEARAGELVREVAAALEASGEQGLRIALEVYEDRRRFADAAAIAERLGELERAAELYRKAHRDLDAARLLEDLGRDREAGQLLERLVAHGAGDPELAPAHLRLGLLLARRMQHDAAVRHLQEASRHADTRRSARPALAVELAALGLRDAARDVLVSARADDPSLPAELDELLLRSRDERPAPEQEAEVQIIAGRYRLERLLGAGGAGRVFLARDEVAGRRVAVKVFNTAYARGRDAYQRFVREARVAGALRHPNLVEVLDFSAEQGFMVMEYMVGGSLAQRLEQPMSAGAVRRMALDLLGGLELAHQRNIVHRDVKPANIFFDARGTAKLGDFGVAHLLDLGTTQTGGLIGTLAYMSPEQITGAPLTFAADLYSLGVTLFEALTGRLPFLGPDFVAQHLGERAPAPSALAPELPSGWDAVLARLLEKNPSDRFGSVDELRHAIDAVQSDASSAAPLVLPRARPRPVTDGAAAAFVQHERAEVVDDEPRYRFETPIGRTEISALCRAVDSALDRSVIIERYDEGGLDQPTEARLYSLARGGGPYMQRSLSYDREHLLAVYEAPSGAPLVEAFADAPPPTRVAVRMLMRLARAVAPLHRAGSAHGAIDGHRVVVDALGHPTVLACGLGRPNPDASPAGDVRAIIELIAGALRLEPPTGAALIDALAPKLDARRRDALQHMAAPATGEELYAFAEALEIALLESAARR